MVVNNIKMFLVIKRLVEYRKTYYEMWKNNCNVPQQDFGF